MSREGRAEKILEEAGLDYTSLVPLLATWLPCDAWLDVDAGLLLFAGATTEEMRRFMLRVGEEANQAVVGVGRDVAAFRLGEDRVARILRLVRDEAESRRDRFEAVALRLAPARNAADVAALAAALDDLVAHERISRGAAFLLSAHAAGEACDLARLAAYSAYADGSDRVLVRHVQSAEAQAREARRLSSSEETCQTVRGGTP